MEREIKFRGYTGEKWVFGYYYQDGKDIIQDHTGMAYEVSNVGQFTGLKDCNNKEIYESDIVKIISNGEIVNVFYHKCTFAVKVGNNCIAPIYWHEDIEVISNIYENRDLLNCL